jgi:ribosomal protein L12E/L44/L45/RPP1/RPP2
MAELNFFDSLVSGGPTDVAGFEKEISSQMANPLHMLVADARDVEDLIADALKRRCCHSHGNNNDRRAALHMHLRLKKGAIVDATMTRHELADLAEMIATKGAPNAIVKRLANFYVRIANLRVQIEETRRSLDACCTDIPIINMNNANAKHLRAAHAKNEESLCEKRNENQRELDRIMSALFLDASVGSINPALTEDDLPALETQVKHIAERGCATQELRRLKIMEAALEQQRLDELMAELNA